MTFFLDIYPQNVTHLPSKNFSQANFLRECSGPWDFSAFELFLSKRSRYAMTILFNDTNGILTNKIYIPHFPGRPYQHIPSQKTCIYMYIYICIYIYAYISSLSSSYHFIESK